MDQDFIDDQIDLTELETNDAATSLPACQGTQQIWQNLLNVTGGDLSLPKCSFGTLQYTFQYHKDGDMAWLKRNNENPGKLLLQPYNQKRPMIPLKRLDINTGAQYLGVRINLDGSWDDEFNY